MTRRKSVEPEVCRNVAKVDGEPVDYGDTVWFTSRAAAELFNAEFEKTCGEGVSVPLDLRFYKVPPAAFKTINLQDMLVGSEFDSFLKTHGLAVCEEGCEIVIANEVRDTDTTNSVVKAIRNGHCTLWSNKNEVHGELTLTDGRTMFVGGDWENWDGTGNRFYPMDVENFWRYDDLLIALCDHVEHGNYVLRAVEDKIQATWDAMKPDEQQQIIEEIESRQSERVTA